MEKVTLPDGRVFDFMSPLETSLFASDARRRDQTAEKALGYRLEAERLKTPVTGSHRVQMFRPWANDWVDTGYVDVSVDVTKKAILDLAIFGASWQYRVV